MCPLRLAAEVAMCSLLSPELEMTIKHCHQRPRSRVYFLHLKQAPLLLPAKQIGLIGDVKVCVVVVVGVFCDSLEVYYTSRHLSLNHIVCKNHM